MGSDDGAAAIDEGMPGEERASLEGGVAASEDDQAASVIDIAETDEEAVVSEGAPLASSSKSVRTGIANPR